MKKVDAIMKEMSFALCFRGLFNTLMNVMYIMLHDIIFLYKTHCFILHLPGFQLIDDLEAHIIYKFGHVTVLY